MDVMVDAEVLKLVSAECHGSYQLRRTGQKSHPVLYIHTLCSPLRHALMTTDDIKNLDMHLTPKNDKFMSPG